MPCIDSRPRSLAGVIEAVKSKESLSAEAKRELTSAVRTFCCCVSRSAAEVDANPSAIRALSRHAKPELAGVGKAHFRNTRSRVTRALTEVGIKVDRRRNMPLDASWTELLATVTDRGRVDLRKFAGWCSAREMAPKAVAQATFVDYFTFLQEQSIQHNVRERWHRARRVWNAEVAIAGSAYPRIESVSLGKVGLISVDDLPARFGSELAAYRAEMTRPTLSGGGSSSRGLLTERLISGRSKALRPATARGYAANLGLLAGYLVRDGVAPDYFTGLDRLVDPVLLMRGLERIQRDVLADREPQRANSPDAMTAPPTSDPGEPVPLVTAVAYAVLNLAKYLRSDPAVLEKIEQLAARTRVKRTAMTAKNKARLGQFADRRAVTLLLDLPARVLARHAEVEKATFKQAREVQNAAILAVLTELPMRVGNLADLDLDRHFQRPVGSAGGKWLVSIPAHEVKNDETIDGEFTLATSALLDRYVAVFRPAISDELTTFLFPGRSGTAKRSTTISTQFTAFIRRETGFIVNPHLMRAFAANICLEANPGDFEMARRLLAHKSINTTRKSYVHLDQRRAFTRYHGVLEAIRDEGSRGGVTAFDFGRRRGGGK